MAYAIDAINENDGGIEITMPLSEGIHQMGLDAYLADPCEAPSLSASIAHTLLTYSPLHAWTEHPRLNPAFQRDDETRFDLGTVAHACLLEGETGFAVIDAPDWRTKTAREAREAARTAGKTPILAEQWATVQAMVKAAGPQLDAHEDAPRPLADGLPEQTLVWREGDVWCRARVDWLHHNGDVDDYKTVGGSANPEAWTRSSLFSNGFDLQAAFYLRGVAVLFSAAAAFRFIVQETFPPYALSVIGLAPDVLTIAEKKRRHAVEVWRYCLQAGRWPGYPTRTCYAELPTWEETRWLEREVREEQPRDDARPIGELL